MPRPKPSVPLRPDVAAELITALGFVYFLDLKWDGIGAHRHFSATLPNSYRRTSGVTVSQCEPAECSSRLHSNASLDSIRGRCGRRIVKRARYYSEWMVG